MEETWRDKLMTPFWRTKYAYSNVRNKIRNHRNTLKIRTLKRGWIDCDHVLLHASFQIMHNFIVEECSPGVVDWDASDDHAHAMHEMLELDRWWTVDPFAQDTFWTPDNLGDLVEDTFVSAYLKKYRDVEMYLDDAEWILDAVGEQIAADGAFNPYMASNYVENAADLRQNEQLKRLIDVRLYMWT